MAATRVIRSQRRADAIAKLMISTEDADPMRGCHSDWRWK
jgi:hypothetical protein